MFMPEMTAKGQGTLLCARVTGEELTLLYVRENNLVKKMCLVLPIHMYNFQYHQTNFFLIDNLHVNHIRTWHLQELFILQV